MDDWVNLDPDETFDNAEHAEEDPAAPIKGDRASPSAREPSPERDRDEPVCRICFSGADEADLGVYTIYKLLECS